MGYLPLKFVGHSANQVGFALPNYNDLTAELLGNQTKSGIKRRKFLGTARYAFQRHGGFKLCVNPRFTLPSKLMPAHEPNFQLFSSIPPLPASPVFILRPPH